MKDYFNKCARLFMFSQKALWVLILTLLVFVLPASGAHAEGTWWDVFFPSNRNIPAETLQAPFADPDAVVLEPEDDSALALNAPHRPKLEVAHWVEQRVSDMLVFTSQNYQEEYKQKIAFFDKAGSAEYLKFLQDNNILKPLSTGTYDIKGFASDLPNILNEGALNGRYRWLLQVPIMVTFVKTGIDDYKQAKPDETMTMEYIINLQVGRSDVAGNDIGLLIESWKATLVKKDKE
jgi:hypothetical protein